MSHPTRIYPFLFLGSHKEAVDKGVLHGLGITHVIALGDNLTTAFAQAQKQGISTFEFKVFDVQDDPQANIKQYFDEAVKFISSGKKFGYVLVHCPTGDSRAAAIVVAYIIKSSPYMTFQDAVDIVKESRTSVSINNGFMAQLREYFDSLHQPDNTTSTATTVTTTTPSTTAICTTTTDTTSTTCSTTSTTDATTTTSTTSTTCTTTSTTDATTTINTTSTTSTTTTATCNTAILIDSTANLPSNATAPITGPLDHPDLIFTCKQCRTPIFTNLNLTEHLIGGGQTAFRWRKRAADARMECTSYFLDEMSWMLMCSEIEGKLFCPSCSARLGAWNLSGMQCSCGAWCAPAFQISKARVDEKKVTTLPNGKMRKNTTLSPNEDQFM